MLVTKSKKSKKKSTWMKGFFIAPKATDIEICCSQFRDARLQAHHRNRKFEKV